MLVKNAGRQDWVGNLRKADGVNPSLGDALDVEGDVRVQEHPGDEGA